MNNLMDVKCVGCFTIHSRINVHFNLATVSLHLTHPHLS
ncbi:unnamed protein product [Rhodiola kirilowii]